MLIPLGNAVPGSLSAIDTSELSGDDVIDEMRKDDDQGIDRRKDMAEFKEREADEAEQKAAGLRDSIADEEARLAAERRRIEDARRKAEQDAGRNSGDQARAQDLDKREDAAKAQDLDKREDALEDKKDQAQQLEDFAGKKRDEAQADRESIAQDQMPATQVAQSPPQDTGQGTQNQRQNTAERPAPGEEPAQDRQKVEEGGVVVNEGADVIGLLGVTLLRPNSPLGRIVKINPASGKELKRSGLDSVNIRTITFINGKIVAVVGQEQTAGGVHLAEIDPDSLELTKQGSDDIHSNSLVWVKGNDLYAIVTSEGNLYLVRFNTDLDLQAKSSIMVHPYAMVFFENNMIMTQRADGEALMLDPTDLSEITE
jgi:hypothetical protein